MYLAKILLAKGYRFYGIKRKASLFNTDRIDHLYQDSNGKGNYLTLQYSDLTNLIQIIQHMQPNKIYILAAMSEVAVSLDTPEYEANADGTGIGLVFWKPFPLLV